MTDRQQDHAAVLRELRDTGDVSDWRAMEDALDYALAALEGVSAKEICAAHDSLRDAGIGVTHVEVVDALYAAKGLHPAISDGGGA